MVNYSLKRHSPSAIGEGWLMRLPPSLPQFVVLAVAAPVPHPLLQRYNAYS
jgi:hypothetical protein